MAIAPRGPGRTPEARVEWALKFRLLDLTKLSERARHRAWAMLVAWERGRPAEGPRPAQDKVLEAQQALREVIEALANGLPDVVYMPEITWSIWPARRRRPGARRGGRVTVTTDHTRPGGLPVTPEAVVLAFVNDLNAVEADRLKACPLKTGEETTCGAIFLAARRQIYCTARHAQAAAWLRYQPKRKTKEALS